MATVDLPRPDVPRPIAVVRDFVNTTDHETGIDDLTTPAELSRYLTTEGLLDRPARATRQDLELALRLRRGLRRALELNHDGVTETVPELAQALAELPVALDWSGDATGCGPRAPASAARWPGSASLPTRPPQRASGGG